jgi:hypothetical protein
MLRGATAAVATAATVEIVTASPELCDQVRCTDQEADAQLDLL